MGWLLSRAECPPMQRCVGKSRRLMTLAVACVFFGAGHSQAQLYKWVDENGKIQYGDSIPPASTDRARQELRSDGTVKSATERAATIEEKRVAAGKAVELAKLSLAQHERDRKDKALLMTYTSLVDFDRVRDRALASLNTDITRLAAREILLGKTIAANGLLPVEPGIPAANTPPLKSANVVLLEAKSELPRLSDSLLRKRRDLDALAASYAADRVRLSELMSAEKAKLSANPASVSVAVPAANPAAQAPAKRQ